MKCFIFAAFLVILFLSLQQAHGLECYKCKSSKSWDDCSKSKTKVTCKSTAKNCCKATYSTTVLDTECTYYQMYCEGEEKVDNKCDGKLSFSWSATRICCSGSLCNSGPLSRGSRSQILAFVALVFLFHVFH